MMTKDKLLKALLQNEKALELVAHDLQVAPGDITCRFGEPLRETGEKGETMKIYIDGGARGNPGEGGAGVVLFHPGGEEEGYYFYFDHITNNAAEYHALLYGLDIAVTLPGSRSFHFFSDSELLCRQINGQYKVKNPLLLQLYTQCKKRILTLNEFTISHVKRSLNKKADKLVNIAIDSKKKGKIKLTDA